MVLNQFMHHSILFVFFIFRKCMMKAKILKQANWQLAHQKLRKENYWSSYRSVYPWAGISKFWKQKCIFSFTYMFIFLDLLELTTWWIRPNYTFNNNESFKHRGWWNCRISYSKYRNIQFILFIYLYIRLKITLKIYLLITI